MTKTGNPKDNAVAERVNNTIKNELLKGMSFTSIPEVSEAVKASICFYNEERPHLSLDGLTPHEVARKKAKLTKMGKLQRKSDKSQGCLRYFLYLCTTKEATLRIVPNIFLC